MTGGVLAGSAPVRVGFFRLAERGAESDEGDEITYAQKAFIIMQSDDGTPVAEVCRNTRISQATFFNWKKKYGCLKPSEMKRLRELEQENVRLKKIVVDLSLVKEMLQDVIKLRL